MPQYKLDSGLPTYPNGLGDREVGLVLPIYRAINSLAQQLSMLSGNVQYSAGELLQLNRLQGLTDGNYMKVTILASENLGFGNLLNLSVSNGEIRAVKASANDINKPAHAVLNMPGGLLSGQAGTALFMRGMTTGISGTAFGATYYLGNSGGLVASVPTGDGSIKQVVGVGLGSAGFYLNIQPVGKVIARAGKPSAAVLRLYYTDGTHDDVAV